MTKSRTVKPMPLHQQLREQLLNRILRGEWAPGTAMATEHELAAEYGVSRQTIREAIRALRYEGFVQARRGSGTFIRQALPGGPLTIGFGTSLRILVAASGWATRVISQEMRVVGEAEAALEVPPGTPVRLIERLRLRDGRPFGLTYSFCLAGARTDVAPDDRPFGGGSLVVLATVLQPYEARLLDDVAHSAALQVEMLCRSADGRAAELHRSVIPNANLRVDVSLDGSEITRLDQVLGLADVEG